MGREKAACAYETQMRQSVFFPIRPLRAKREDTHNAVFADRGGARGRSKPARGREIQIRLQHRSRVRRFQIRIPIFYKKWCHRTYTSSRHLSLKVFTSECIRSAWGLAMPAKWMGSGTGVPITLHRTSHVWLLQLEARLGAHGPVSLQ